MNDSERIEDFRANVREWESHPETYIDFSCISDVKFLLAQLDMMIVALTDCHKRLARAFSPVGWGEKPDE